MERIMNKLCDKYGTEYIAEVLEYASEWVNAVITGAVLFGGLLGMWFMGCALAG